MGQPATSISLFQPRPVTVNHHGTTDHLTPALRYHHRGRVGPNTWSSCGFKDAIEILCAESIASDDRITSDELLKQIRKHSFSDGDGSQRLAYYFANAMEARLAGTGAQIYTSLSSKRTTDADMIKAYQLFFCICPFKRISIGFANHSILNAVENKTKLHIIDFGILYGFQWPLLLQAYRR